MGAESKGSRMRLLAIDPGAKTGYAVFDHAGLETCGVCAVEDLEHRYVDAVVIESPVIYPHQKARPKDILTLARIVGRYQERFARAAVILIEPRAWKGTLSKPKMLARIRKELTPKELAIFEACKGDDNTLDAIGIGKYFLRAQQTTTSP
jgi:hypothetical protein